ncbi:PspA/IM30 family protein [Oceanobacillus luteolus]|uniref:PspA/IM30 family protein n=1 Tax=Oceanobacillus luteolus TaxID=1274358 RepID=A0ABW4HMM1_9BACI|nr:PspA/IM30 family protein [Oceanobacillus luteolus]MCM3739827.1 PspA/IM30 family protein [Oceanobacillus luteolus]
MGILSRFSTLMKANINHHLDVMKQPDKIVQKTLRDINLDLRTVNSERNALESDVKRAKQAVDECEAEIRKLERYRERVEERDYEKAMMFANKQEELETKKLELVSTYNQLIVDAKQLKLLEEKLALDLRQLELRSYSIREKTALLNQQEKINTSDSHVSSGFSSYEEELNFKIDEAEALAKLRNQTKEIENIDAEISKLIPNKDQESN